MNKKSLNKRTPRFTAQSIPMSGPSRKPRQAIMYEKIVALKIVGSDPAKIQDVAREIHSTGYCHTTGGKEERTVTVVPISSSIPPMKIFDGLVE